MTPGGCEDRYPTATLRRCVCIQFHQLQALRALMNIWHSLLSSWKRYSSRIRRHLSCSQYVFLQVTLRNARMALTAPKKSPRRTASSTCLQLAVSVLLTSSSPCCASFLAICSGVLPSARSSSMCIPIPNA